MKYKNACWHSEANKSTGPEFYETEAKPLEYRDYKIYERIKGVCWDVVINGICIANRAGLSGAKSAIDGLLGGK